MIQLADKEMNLMGYFFRPSAALAVIGVTAIAWSCAYHRAAVHAGGDVPSVFQFPKNMPIYFLEISREPTYYEYGADGTYRAVRVPAPGTVWVRDEGRWTQGADGILTMDSSVGGCPAILSGPFIIFLKNRRALSWLIELREKLAVHIATMVEKKERYSDLTNGLEAGPLCIYPFERKRSQEGPFGREEFEALLAQIDKRLSDPASHVFRLRPLAVHGRVCLQRLDDWPLTDVAEIADWFKCDPRRQLGPLGVPVQITEEEYRRESAAADGAAP